jgi:CheY-like chemotaxis protein
MKEDRYVSPDHPSGSFF